MTDRELPSPELLRKLLRYEPESGKLFWLERGKEHFSTKNSWSVWNTRYANKEAFTAKSHGYKTGSIFNCKYFAHRVIWAMQTGYWPKIEIDHIDRDPINNAWSNLRQATSSQNKTNRASYKNSTSKYLGVSWFKRDKKWVATIKENGVKKHLGLFVCEIEAAKAYNIAAEMSHGKFANLNVFV